MDTQEAFKTLLGELQNAFERTQESIEDAMKRSDFSAIREAADRGETIQEQIDQLKTLQTKWTDIVGAGAIETAKPTPRDTAMAWEAYRLPILRALEEMEGRGKTAKVVDRVGELIEDRLSEADRQMLPSGAEIRWRNRVRWARNAMVNDGLLASDSPRGIWEITEKGQKVLQAGGSR